MPVGYGQEYDNPIAVGSNREGLHLIDRHGCRPTLVGIVLKLCRTILLNYSVIAGA